LARVQRTHLAERRKHLESLGRVLESSSYRSALERGFAVVRGEDGAIRRRAGRSPDIDLRRRRTRRHRRRLSGAEAETDTQAPRRPGKFILTRRLARMSP